MAIELLKPVLTFRGLSDDDEATDPNIQIGDEEVLDPEVLPGEEDDDAPAGGEMMGNIGE